MKALFTLLATLTLALGCQSAGSGKRNRQSPAGFVAILNKTNREIYTEIPEFIRVGTKVTEYREVLALATSTRRCDIAPILRLDRGANANAGAPMPGTQYIFRARGAKGPTRPGDCLVDIFVDDGTKTVVLVRVLPISA